jgi:hypothetical protein
MLFEPAQLNWLRFFDNATEAYYPDIRNQFIYSTISESLNS